MTTDANDLEATLKAGMDLLSERGFSGTTLDQVAVRARVQPYAVHSQWRSRSELIAELLRHYGDQPPELPDTGELRSDLVAVLSRLVETVHSVRFLLATAVGEAARDPELALELRLFVLSWQKLARDLVARAVEREQLPSWLDQDWALDLVCSIVYFRILLLGDLSLKDVAERLADEMLRAWGVR